MRNFLKNGSDCLNVEDQKINVPILMKSRFFTWNEYDKKIGEIKKQLFNFDYWAKYVLRDEACLKIDIDFFELLDIENLKTWVKENNLNNVLNFESEKDFHSDNFMKFVLNNNKIASLIKFVENIKNRNTKSSGLWNQNGMLTKDELNEILEKTTFEKNQIVWDNVISLDKNFAENVGVMSGVEFQSLIKKHIHLFFKKSGFKDPSKIQWYFSFHKNTDNPHIHLMFYEKEPTQWKKGSLEFKKKGILSVNEMKMFCFNMAKEALISKDHLKFLEEERNITLLMFKEHTEKYYSELKTKNKISWNNVKTTFNMIDEKNNALKEKINVIKKIHKKSKITYNSKYLPKYIKDYIDSISLDLIYSDKALFEQYSRYRKEVEIYQNKLDKIALNYDSNSDFEQESDETNDENEETKSFYEQYKFYHDLIYGKDGLMSRLGNEILKNIDTIEKPKQNKNNNIWELTFNYPKTSKLKLKNFKSSAIKDLEKILYLQEKETERIYNKLLEENQFEREKTFNLNKTN